MRMHSDVYGLELKAGHSHHHKIYHFLCILCYWAEEHANICAHHAAVTFVPVYFLLNVRLRYWFTRCSHRDDDDFLIHQTIWTFKKNMKTFILFNILLGRFPGTWLPVTIRIFRSAGTGWWPRRSLGAGITWWNPPFGSQVILLCTEVKIRLKVMSFDAKSKFCFSSHYPVYSAWVEIPANCRPPGGRRDLRSFDGSERKPDDSNRDHGETCSILLLTIRTCSKCVCLFLFLVFGFCFFSRLTITRCASVLLCLTIKSRLRPPRSR